ncbi:MAG: TonB-dependent receptor [Bacteroidota bacterium]
MKHYNRMEAMVRLAHFPIIKTTRWMLLLLLASVFFCQQTLEAQTTKTSKISGKLVSKSKGEPVAGATITIKGTNEIALTDAAGNYTIQAAPGSTLVITSVGFAKTEVKVGNSATLDLQLDETINNLDDVVVVGYGKMKKTDLSSSQVVVTAADLKKTVNTTFEQGLQGRAANVYVTSNSGQPGAAPTVMIRGVNSLNYSNQPLYVIDGVQIKPNDPSGGSGTSTNLLAGINPDDIETLNVLQGPSATAIYGATGANGVIMITTKRGKAGETKINFNALNTIQDKPSTVPVMNLQQYATYRNEMAKNGNIPFEPSFADPSVLGPGTNWQDALFRTTMLQKYGVSLSGGSDKTTFYVGTEYFSQEGVVQGSGFDRYSIRLNLENQTRKWLKIGTNLNVNQTKQVVNTSNGDLLNIAIRQSPDIPVKNPDGSWGGPTSTQYQITNPVALSSINDNHNKSMAFIGGMYADITLLKGLVFHNEANGSYQYTNGYSFNPSYKFNGFENSTTVSSRTAGNNYWWGFNSRLQYDTKIGAHAIAVMAGHESSAYGSEGLDGLRRNYVTNAIQELSGGDALTATNSSSKNSGARESYFGRLNYVYNNKYILQATFRADGTSNFGPENRWGYFPAFSAAWRVSQENFMQNVAAISDLKIRAEYGIVGNSAATGYFAKLYTVPTAWGTGYLSANFSNPFLQWENDKTSNLGFDLRMFKNRVELVGDFYLKKIDKLLTTNDYPYYSGGDIAYSSGYIGFPTTNVGSMENKGLGLSLNTRNIERKGFTWNSGINFSIDKNKITALNDERPINSTYKGSSLITSSRVGQSVALITGYVAEGIFQNIEEIKKHAIQTANGVMTVSPTQGTWVGDIKFKDINNDGLINQDDRVVLGNPWPKFTYGINNGFTYKGFDLNIFIMGVQGNDVANYTRFLNENPSGTSPSSNYFQSVSNFARPSSTDVADDKAFLTNPGFQIARINTGDPNGNNRFNSWYIEDGSYLRIKNITLGYNLPNQWISKIGMKGIRVSGGVQNLATFTKYKGYDPEIGVLSSWGTPPISGVDDGRYPTTRIYTFSLSADF